MDAKQKLLLALYTIYQKDEYITLAEEQVGLTRGMLNAALIRLYNERLVSDIGITIEQCDYKNCKVSKLIISPEGIRYIEDWFGISSYQSSERKVSNLVTNARLFDFNEEADFVEHLWHQL